MPEIQANKEHSGREKKDGNGVIVNKWMVGPDEYANAKEWVQKDEIVLEFVGYYAGKWKWI